MTLESKLAYHLAEAGFYKQWQGFESYVIHHLTQVDRLRFASSRFDRIAD